MSGRIPVLDLIARTVDDLHPDDGVLVVVVSHELEQRVIGAGLNDVGLGALRDRIVATTELFLKSVEGMPGWRA